MFQPDLHEQDPEKRKTYERLTRAINEARTRKKGDIELLELIAKDPQAFIRQQGWSSVSLDGDHTLMELRSLYEHLQARILKLIETLDTLHASPDYEVFLFAEKDAVIHIIVVAQREELEQEIEELQAEARAGEREIEELVGETPFQSGRHGARRSGDGLRRDATATRRGNWRTRWCDSGHSASQGSAGSAGSVWISDKKTADLFGGRRFGDE
jgi:hypothetical protein